MPINKLVDAINANEKIQDGSQIAVDLMQLDNQINAKLNENDIDQEDLLEVVQAQGNMEAQLVSLEKQIASQDAASDVSKEIDTYKKELELKIDAAKQSVVTETEKAVKKEEEKSGWFSGKGIIKKIGAALLSIASIGSIFTLIPKEKRSAGMQKILSGLKLLEVKGKKLLGMEVTPEDEAALKGPVQTRERLGDAENVDDQRSGNLARQLLEHKDNFKWEKDLERLQYMDADVLEMMLGLIVEFPDIRFTSTIRSESENKAEGGSARNSGHMRGHKVDIGRCLKKPPTYTIAGVERYIKETYPRMETLIHEEGDDRHLDVGVKKVQLAENKRTDEKASATFTM